MGSTPERELRLLTEGGLELVGQIVRSSNETFLVNLSLGEQTGQAVYKPVAGERPLSDFPPGLHRRERAAYLLSEELGWGLVPPTVIRKDAPLGEGSLQWFVDCDFREHYFTISSEDPSTHPDMARMALFDYLANNTDRKSGHVLRGNDKRIWGIDHGLCFSAISKLRTVIWDFAGEPIPEALLADIAPLASAVPAALAELLDGDEVSALQRRTQRMLDGATLPVDLTGSRYPWPLV